VENENVSGFGGNGNPLAKMVGNIIIVII